MCCILASVIEPISIAIVFNLVTKERGKMQMAIVDQGKREELPCVRRLILSYAEIELLVVPC